MSTPAPKKPIVIRPYLPKDRSQVWAMLDVGFATGPDSPGTVALRRSLFTPLALASYAGFTLGALAALTTRAVHPRVAFAAAVATVVSAGTPLYMRHGIEKAFLDFCEQARQSDMRDIEAYYKTLEEREPAQFLVAVIEATDGSGEDEVVGFVGLEHLPSRPSVGRLRRMIVSPYHRRRGIGSRLLDAVVAHARLHAPSPLEVLELETSTFQPAAQELYKRYGFVQVGTRVIPWGPFRHELKELKFRLKLV
uniref:N-acetyltransferase domain-containing protein n=1 Tax=Mycena chlorophos TaxID=658473 RepID=A0ABQ0LU35_MYCCL|nr:predicted protein [Mycena chlorophos]